MTFHNSILPVSLANGHFYFNRFQSTIFFELFGVEASFFINMETCKMSKVTRPFSGSSYKVSSVAVAKLRIVVATTLSDDLCCVILGCFVNEV